MLALSHGGIPLKCKEKKLRPAKKTLLGNKNAVSLVSEKKKQNNIMNNHVDPSSSRKGKGGTYNKLCTPY